MSYVASLILVPIALISEVLRRFWIERIWLGFSLNVLVLCVNTKVIVVSLTNHHKQNLVGLMNMAAALL